VSSDRPGPRREEEGQSPAHGPDVEALRTRMRHALGEHADPRADALVREAEVVVAAEASTWEGSAGRVQAHRVGLGLGAAELGTVSATPHLEDELVRAAAAGIAALEPAGARWTLRHLQLFWLASGRPSPAGYRDGPPPGPITLVDAMVAFLRARGDVDAAARIADGTVQVLETTDPVTVRDAPRELHAAIQACLQALLCGFDGHRSRGSFVGHRA